MSKRAVLYMRVSSLDQHPETQFYNLRQMAAERGFEIVQESRLGTLEALMG